MKLDLPSPARDVDQEGNFERSWVKFLSRVRDAFVWRTQAGATADRPTSGLEIGTTYYDTTLGYLVCVHQVNPAVVWHNGAGVAV